MGYGAALDNAYPLCPELMPHAIELRSLDLLTNVVSLQYMEIVVGYYGLPQKALYSTVVRVVQLYAGYFAAFGQPLYPDTILPILCIDEHIPCHVHDMSMSVLIVCARTPAQDRYGHIRE